MMKHLLFANSDCHLLKMEDWVLFFELTSYDIWRRFAEAKCTGKGCDFECPFYVKNYGA